MQDKLKTQQEQNETSNSEHDKTVAQLKRLLSSAEAEVTAVQQRMEQQATLLDSAKEESTNVVQQLKRRLADQDEEVERKTMEMDRVSCMLCANH